MKIALIGATGRTGDLLLQTLQAHQHEVVALVRNPAALSGGNVRVVAGSSTDTDAMAELVQGVDAVMSALGPRTKETDLHTQTARVLVDVLPDGFRFVGISGAGIDVPGDAKSRRDRVISLLIQKFGGDLARDKALEYGVFAGSHLRWTLARPPRLQDGPPTGSYYSDAHTPGRSSSIRRADLAAFLVDCLEHDLYVQQAPFVSAR